MFRIKREGPGRPAKKDVRDVCLIIPMTEKGIEEFYSLPLVDQEILSDQLREYADRQLQAFTAFRQPKDRRFEIDIPITHPAQLKSSYTP